MRENVQTENSTEIQARKTAILNGITWTKARDEANDTELHIGQVANYQIYLSESKNLYQPGKPRTYTIALWEMCVKTKLHTSAEINTNFDVMVTRPGYTQLITDRIIIADNIESAKLAAVDCIMQWNEARLNAAKTEYDKLSGVFGHLPEIYSSKIAALRAADSVNVLKLSNAATNALVNNNILVIGDLTNLTVRQLKAKNGLGGSRGQEVLFALKSMGIIMQTE